VLRVLALLLSLSAGSFALASRVSQAGAQPTHADVFPLARSDPRLDRAARLVARGRVLREGGDTISALAYFRDAIAAAPRRAEGYEALGELYLALDEPVRAIEVYEAGARWAVRGEALWLGLAAALHKLGQDERALDALRRLHALDPGSRAGLVALAEASEARGSFVEALAARRALVALLAAEPKSDALAAELADQNARVRALSYLLGAADRVRTRTICKAEHSLVRRALAHCP
jgi:tetratricopeptide (TPR) repeat protein